MLERQRRVILTCSLSFAITAAFERSMHDLCAQNKKQVKSASVQNHVMRGFTFRSKLDIDSSAREPSARDDMVNGNKEAMATEKMKKSLQISLTQ